MYSSVALCSRGEDFGPLRGERPCFPLRTLSIKFFPAQRDHHARGTERKAKAGYLGDPTKGGGGLVELLLVTWPEGRLSGQATLARLSPSRLVLIECYLKRDSAD
jgi:hypothetical protein